MDEIELGHSGSRLRLGTLGAECLAWSIGGRDLLWTRDAAFWDRVAPVLFPVCGWTRQAEIRVGGRSYPLGLHGFAPQSRFRVDTVGADHACLVLRDDDQTRALFPFSFELSVTYRLEELALSVVIEIRNRGRQPLPYATGLHPGFRIDPTRPVAVVFDEPEIPEVPVIAPGGLFSAQRRGIPLKGCRLELTPETFAKEALCFVPARSRGLKLELGDGTGLRAEFPGFSNLVLWSRPGAPFLCVEPWTGFGDPDDFTGDIFQKPGMRLLGAGDRARHEARFIFEG